MAHIRLGTREEDRNPLSRDFALLASLDDIVFGGWDPISANAVEAARVCGVLEDKDLAPISQELEGTSPWTPSSTRGG
jgi:myo-inositol-1-phosphate synthase